MNAPKAPSFGVAIPAYNAESSIVNAIRSAVRAGAAEVLVVDDGSTDRTVECATQHNARVISQKNAGAASARERCIRESPTELLILLDADDELIPEGVHAALATLAENPTWAGTAGAYTQRTAARETLVPLWSEGISLMALLNRGFAPAPPGAFVWRRRALVAALEAPPKVVRPPWAEDYELLIRAAHEGHIGTVATSVCRYTATGGKSTVDPTSSIAAAEDLRRYYAAHYAASIRQRSKSDIRALSLSRQATGAALGPRIVLMMRSMAASPSLYKQLVANRLRRTTRSIRLSRGPH